MENNIDYIIDLREQLRKEKKFKVKIFALNFVRGDFITLKLSFTGAL